MPARLSWSNLIPGLVGVAVIGLIVTGILVFAGVGKIRGETVRIYVLTDQARGLIPGSDVWLDGQKAGVVDHVGFRPPSRDTLHRVVIGADVSRDAADRLRHDSRIQVRSGGSFIGPVVVALESGTPEGQPVREGDTLRALAQPDLGSTLESFGVVTAQFPALLADVKTVMAQASSPSGTIGAFRAEGVGREMRELRRTVGSFMAGASEGPAERAAMMRRARAAMARADSVRSLVGSSATSLGRFRRDSTLPRAIGELRDELAELRRDMEATKGTLWRLQNDSALFHAVGEMRAEMARLFDDVRRRPLRYLHF